MDILVLKFALMALMATVTLLCVLLPLKYSGPKAVEDVKSSLLFALASSLTTGVFLATCFVQAMPLVDGKFMEIFKDMDPSDALSISQCCVLFGFVCIMFLEQIVDYYQHKQNNHGCEAGETVQIVEIPDGYLASSDESDNGGIGEDESKKAMLPKKKRKNKPGPASTDLSTRSPVQLPRQKKVARPFKAGAKPLPSPGNHVAPHGSGHCHGHMVDVLEQHHGFRCILLMLALSAHTLFEGMAVGLQTDTSNLVNFFLGVLVHECFISFAVGVNMAKQNIKRRILVVLAVTFSMTVPVGMLIGMAIGQECGFAASLSSALLQALAAGTFLYVIFLEILPPEIYAKQRKVLRFICMLVGFGIILALRFGLHGNHDQSNSDTC